jgi:hypothetical protein
MTLLRLDVRPKRYASNPIIGLGGSGTWYEKQIFDPVPMIDPANSANLVMWVTGMAAPVATGEMSIGRCTSTVADPYSWTVTGQVLSKAAGEWDDNHVRLGSVLYDSGTYYMYYTGGPPGTGTSIGLATSDDGITWTRHASNPILTPNDNGRDDGDHVSEPAVIKEGSDWTMIYSYRNGATVLPGYRYATSSDGVTWTKGGTGDILTTAPLYGEFHQLLKINGSYVLIYESGTGEVPYRLFAATSGVAIGPYANIPQNPFLEETGVADDWDEFHVATGAIIEVNNIWRLLYVGAGDLSQPYVNNTWPMGIADFQTRAFCGGNGMRR